MGEDELAKLAEGLEQLRLSLKQNIQIENDLKQANQNLITGIAHDLRTPLTALTMYKMCIRDRIRLFRLSPGHWPSMFSVSFTGHASIFCAAGWKKNMHTDF